MAKDLLQRETLNQRFQPTTADEEVARVLRAPTVKNANRYRPELKKGEVNKERDLPDEQILKAISKLQMANHQDYRSIIELLPELERGMSILESAVLSPKDLLSPKLQYRMLDETVIECKSEVLSIIQSYLTSNYSLNERLPKLLREALHSKGSYTLAAIPRNTVDELVEQGAVKVNMQSLSTVNPKGEHKTLVEPLGLLGIPTKKYEKAGERVNMQSLEDRLAHGVTDELFQVAGLEGLTITDNYNLVKMPSVRAAYRRTQVARAVRPSVGLGSRGNVNMQSASDDHLAQLFKRRDYRKAKSLILSGANGAETVYGRPLEKNWPAEAVIPVHVGGDVTNKVGIILLTDEEGEAITAESVESQFRVLQSSLRTDSENTMSESIERISTALGAGRYESTASSITKHINALQKSFKNMVITDLVDRFAKGVYGHEVGISDSDTMLNLAFKRMLCERGTRMVFVPSEIATYIAFDYDEYGLGRSRLESSKIIASMRAILLYTNMNAAMTNATPNLKLVIDLDEDEQDPEAVVEDTIAEFYALNATRLQPGSTLNSADITKMLQQMGVTISVNGNSRYPSTDVTLEEVSRSKALIDRDLDDSLAKRIWLMMGLSPEAVDSSFDVEFARTIISNNLFLAKLAAEIQTTLLYHYSDHARKLIYSDGNLMTDIVAKVQESTKGLQDDDVMDIVNELIESFHLALPSTDIAKIESQQQAFENYSNFIETALESYVNEEMLDGLVEGELNSVIRPAIRAYGDMLKRDFMQRENILPELQMLSAGKSEDLNLGERFKNHADPVVDVMESLLEHFRKRDRKVDQEEEERIAKEEEKRREEEAAAEAERLAAEEAANPPEDDNLEGTEDGLEDDTAGLEDDTTDPEAPEEDNTDETADDVPADETGSEEETGDDNDDPLAGLDGLDTFDL